MTVSGAIKLKVARIYSDLSGIFLQDELAFDVNIFRLSHERLWHLEVTKDIQPTSLCNRTFVTEHEAWRYFINNFVDPGARL